MKKGISLFERKAEYKCIFLADNALYKLCVLLNFWNQMEESLEKAKNSIISKWLFSNNSNS